MTVFTHALATNNYGPAKFIVSASPALGTHTTITAALAVATSGDNIFLRDGTYTENITIPAGVNLVAFNGDAISPTVTIIGTVTFTAVGACSIANIRLQTNSAALLVVSGANACNVNLFNCFLNCTNATGISFTNSNAASRILVNNTYGDIGTTGIALFASSSAGNLNFEYSNISNSGGSSTANTISAGSLNFFYSSLTNPITVSGTAAIGLELSDFNTTAQNVTALTAGGSGSQTILNASFSSGTASAISISQTLTISQATIDSSNANAITGAGTINYQDLSFPNTSSTINTTTQAKAGTLQGSKNTAPTAGFLGERITSAITGGTPANNTATTLTSISLTAGVWDISGLGYFSYSGNNTASVLNISTTNNAIVGNIGDSRLDWDQVNAAGFIASLSIPAFRVVISTTTSYFLVVQSNFSTGTATVSGRISGVRVG